MSLGFDSHSAPGIEVPVLDADGVEDARGKSSSVPAGPAGVCAGAHEEKPHPASGMTNLVNNNKASLLGHSKH